MKSVMEDQMRKTDMQKIDSVDHLNVDLVQHKMKMGGILDSAKKELAGIQVSMKILYDECRLAVTDIKDLLDNLERNFGGKGGNGMKGYLPLKSMVPGVFSDKAEDWRQWQDDAMDHCPRGYGCQAGAGTLPRGN